MAVPKKRCSHARRGRRSAHKALRRANLAYCPQCDRPKPPHTACPNCGHYAGRAVFKAES